MDKQTHHRQMCAKADQHFARKNYVLAKKEYARALQLAPSDEISARIHVCEEQLALQKRKELIKKGRRLEKKGDLAAAADCFSQALESEREEWLEKKVEQLGRRKREGQAEALIEQISGMAGNATPAERLAACDRALELEQDDRLRQEKLGCLVQLGRYTEAIALFEERVVDGDQGRYDYGYALIADGRYRQGLDQWATLLSAHPALFSQIEACLPGLARELASGGGSYALPHHLLDGLPAAEQTPVLERYRRYFTCRYIEQLWYAGDHTRIGELLPSLPEPVTPPLLGLLARLYFSLAGSDVRWLEPAISYWLTAIYNDDLLQSLQIHGAVPDAPDNRVIRAGLLKLLEEQVDMHARAGRLTPALEAHWQAERRQIERLAALPVGSGGSAVFPCTPAFARRFALSEPILDLLRAQRPHLGLDNPARLELSAHYSPLGHYLVRIEAGSEDKVFNALPPPGADPLSGYLRQCIALGCGIGRVGIGERQTRKYFQAALPLLEGNPHFRRQMIDLAYSEPEEMVLSSLAEAMEFLSRHLPEADFLQAAAHSIAADAENLLHRGVNQASVEKRLKKALAIYPDSHQARSLLAEVRREQTFTRIGKAFKGGDPTKAAHIVQDSDDPEIRGYFLDTMEHWRQDLATEDKTTRLRHLSSMYENCLAIDREHPTTLEIAADLKRLEAD
jgi:tetratricopeptide (TPR) repeat protein